MEGKRSPSHQGAGLELTLGGSLMPPLPCRRAYALSRIESRTISQSGAPCRSGPFSNTAHMLLLLRLGIELFQDRVYALDQRLGSRNRLLALAYLLDERFAVAADRFDLPLG